MTRPAFLKRFSRGRPLGPSSASATPEAATAKGLRMRAIPLQSETIQDRFEPREEQ
jgi:hypothetical protein